MRTLTRYTLIEALNNGPLFDRKLIHEGRSYAGYAEWLRELEAREWAEMEAMDDPNPTSANDVPEHCEVA